MLSRVADNLYWMSRYLERAEQSARLIGVNLTLTIEQSATSTASHWQRVLQGLYVPDAESIEAVDAETVRTLMFARDRPTSVFGCIAAARHNARQVREEISAEMWEAINRLYLRVREESFAATPVLQPADFLRQVVDSLHLVNGTAEVTLSHGEGWQFMQVGRYIERAMAASRLLDVYLSAPGADRAGGGGLDSFLDGIGLLNSCSGFDAYCKTHTGGIVPVEIVEFLLLNAEFPRSVRFAVDMLRVNLSRIAASADQRTGKVERLAGRLQAQLQFSHVDDIMAQNVRPYLLDIQRQCMSIHNAIYETYIRYPVETALAS